MTAGNMFVFVASFVTQCLGAKTHCHHNFGYCSRKCMIPRSVVPTYFGLQYAAESRLVYT
jgi:hypothetical protein